MAIASEAKECKKMEAFPFLHQILHIRRVDSTVTMSIQIRAMGVWIFFYQNGAIWRILSVLKYVIINLKINNFKDNFPQK